MYFRGTYQNYITSTGDELVVAERETITGIIGESMRCLGERISTHVELIYQFLLKCTSDAEPCVRNNTAFALGEIVKYGQGSVAK